MFDFIHSVLNPDHYHREQAHPPYFEGWYYKLVDETEKHHYSIIPGVALAPDEKDSHAFVQVLDGENGASVYHRYPLDDFWAARDAFYITIGPNLFSTARLKVNLPGNPLSLRGELVFCDLTPWPVSLLSPSMMGWYSWVPQMECYHHVLSLDHSIHGHLEINTATVDFTQGRGYIEKDWGQSQPAAWVWLQSNHFETPGTALSVSIAVIPPIAGLTRAFRGCLIGLLHQGTLYRFTTYTGAVIERLESDANGVNMTIRDNLYRLRIKAHATPGANLRSPRNGVMERSIRETLKAGVDVALTTLEGNVEVFTGSGRHAGVEIVGEL